MFNTDPYKERMSQALAHFEDDVKKIRTGRAHPGMLDGVTVEVYGTRMPLNQAANITAPEPQMLLVTPFDPSSVQAVATAIRDDQGLGFNPSDDGRVVRVPLPALTEERRRQLVKQASEKVEEARIALRNIRQDVQKESKRLKEAKQLSEDDMRGVEKQVDGWMSEYNDKIEAAFKLKEKDIMTI